MSGRCIEYLGSVRNAHTFGRSQTFGKEGTCGSLGHHRHFLAPPLDFPTRRNLRPPSFSFKARNVTCTRKDKTSPKTHPPSCLPDSPRPASSAYYRARSSSYTKSDRLLLTAAVTSPPVTVVSARLASIPVVVVWLVVSTTTAPTWTSTIPVTLVRLVCDTSTSSRTSSGSPSSTSTRYVVQSILQIDQHANVKFSALGPRAN